MAVFEGEAGNRSVARNLDYLAYGIGIQERASELMAAIVGTVGNLAPGDAIDGDVSHQK